MNRPLKFRAWDKHEQRFVSTNYDAEPFEIYLDGSYLGLAVGPDWGGEERYTITQWTGLLDSEGTEIYEFDILSSPTWWWGPRYVYWNQGECGACKGDSVGSYILAKDIDDPLNDATYNIWHGSEVTVRGNIYESPDLLEEG